MFIGCDIWTISLYLMEWDWKKIIVRNLWRECVLDLEVSPLYSNGKLAANSQSIILFKHELKKDFWVRVPISFSTHLCQCLRSWMSTLKIDNGEEVYLVDLQDCVCKWNWSFTCKFEEGDHPHWHHSLMIIDLTWRFINCSCNSDYLEDKDFKWVTNFMNIRVGLSDNYFRYLRDLDLEGLKRNTSLDYSLGISQLNKNWTALNYDLCSRGA